MWRLLLKLICERPWTSLVGEKGYARVEYPHEKQSGTIITPDDPQSFMSMPNFLGFCFHAARRSIPCQTVISCLASSVLFSFSSDSNLSIFPSRIFNMSSFSLITLSRD